MVGIISVVIGGHFAIGGGDHFDGGDHFGGGTAIALYICLTTSAVETSSIHQQRNKPRKHQEFANYE